MDLVKGTLRNTVFLLVSPGAVHILMIHQLLTKLMVIHIYSGTASSSSHSSLSHWKIAVIICVYISVFIPNLKSHIT